MNKAINELTIPQQQLQIIDDVKAGLAAMEEECRVVLDLTTAEGLEEGRKRLRKLVKARNAVEKARLAHNKALKDQIQPDIEHCNNLANEQIQPRIAKIETPLAQSIKAIDDAEAARVVEEARIEAERVDKIQGWIDTIKTMPIRLVSIDDLASAIESLESIELQHFDEFAGAAAKVCKESLAELRTKHAELVKQQQEREALERERAEFENERAELQALRAAKEPEPEPEPEPVYESEPPTGESDEDLLTNYIAQLLAVPRPTLQTAHGRSVLNTIIAQLEDQLFHE